MDRQNKSVIIIFFNVKTGKQEDLEVPLNISANELIKAIRTVYCLEGDYLKCENPIALLRGNKTLAEYGLHDGSMVIYS